MISAQNLLQQLSGNKRFILLILGLCLAACSPKIQAPGKKKSFPATSGKEREEKISKKLTEANVSLLVPFKLNEIDLKSASKSDVEKAAMAIDFYQGVRLGIDSAAASMGLNFKLNVYDTQDENSQITDLFKNNQLEKSNLLIGPVFPDELKHIKEYAVVNKLPVVSPLAASRPEEFNNPNLISIVNNIDLHAVKIGNYISEKYGPENTIVVLINPKKSEDEIFGAPLRNYFLDKGRKFTFQEYASVYTLDTKLQKGKRYVILVSSSDRPFVAETIDKLIKMKKAGLEINLFGHPNWMKQNYSTDKLQALNTCITSSYKVDYKNPAVIAFVKKYRRAFDFEPSEYSFKGFDTGFYFGRLLSQHGADFLKYLTKEKYKGLHNSFSFIHDEKQGHVNTSLMLLKYNNYTLSVVQ